jgi:hypothetical protein
MPSETQKGQRASPGTGIEGVPRWHGIYLGTVTHTREQDLWVRMNVPQLLGDKEITNWARPAGHNTVGAINPPTAAYKVVPNPVDIADQSPVDKGWADRQPQGWGGHQKDPGSTDSSLDSPEPTDRPSGRGRPMGFGDEKGPGPPPGTLVLVQFLGGDINEPVYHLTSQKAAT